MAEVNYGGGIFALVVVVLFAQFGGFCVKLIRGFGFDKSWGILKNVKIRGCCNMPVCKKITIPPLIGMIVFGCLARNFV